jgi:hypothetical protein
MTPPGGAAGSRERSGGEAPGSPQATGSLERPAFYALRPGGWRDLVTLLHPPYTAWNLANVAIGAALAPHMHWDRLLAALGAFLLAVGVCAHVLDELNGRPLGTQLSERTLVALAALSLAGAVAIGVVGALTISLTLLAFVAVGAFIVMAYNLEWFGGRFHTTFWLAAAWGAFPALTGYWVNALSLRASALLAAAACFMLTVLQRTLSTPARELRRRTVALSGEQRLRDGSTIVLDAARIAAPLERALRACASGVVLLAAGMVAARL